ncbi:MAG: hypothetical protein PHX98_03615 [Candidatus Moranbacteria bacterium]|nr:hypothetical protein [Candidatus Moranbacteria bacterium]
MEESLILKVDKIMRSLLGATNSSKRRSFYKKQITETIKIIEKISADAQIAEWRATRNGSSIGDAGVRNILKKLDPDLERRYLQVIYDLQDEKRISYAGTANELREIIRIVLVLRAPDEEVMKTDWFKENREKPKNSLPEKPTQAERVRFIMEKKRAGDKESKNARDNGELIDGLLGGVVRSSYDRINAGVHSKKDRDEIIRSLRYVHAFLSDIL